MMKFDIMFYTFYFQHKFITDSDDIIWNIFFVNNQILYQNLAYSICIFTNEVKKNNILFRHSAPSFEHNKH